MLAARVAAIPKNIQLSAWRRQGERVRSRARQNIGALRCPSTPADPLKIMQETKCCVALSTEVDEG